MNISAWIAAGFLSLVSTQSLACSCSAEVGVLSPEEEKQAWLERVASACTVVVLALITSVSAREAIGDDAGEKAVLEVREIFKGTPPHTITVKTGWCNNVALKTNEERVFFIVSEGRVRPCSDYRHVMSDEEVGMRLRASAHLHGPVETPIGYTSVRDALNALRGKPSVRFSVQQDGWTIAEDVDVPEIWMFCRQVTPPIRRSSKDRKSCARPAKRFAIVTFHKRSEES